MAKTENPDVSAHLYRDTDVTTERLESFAQAPRHVQLRVMAALRERAVEDNLELTIMAILLAIILPIASIGIAPEATPAPLWAKVAAAIILGLLLGFVFGAIIGWRPIRDHRRRQVATVWLGAYQDELERRRAQPGRSARRWRAMH